jgi:hypothetical protein
MSDRFEANENGIVGPGCQGHNLVGPSGPLRALLLSSYRLHGRPWTGSAGLFHLNLKTSNAGTEHVVPKAQFWAAHRPQRNLRGAQRSIRVGAGKANDIAYGVLTPAGVVRIWSGKVVRERNRVNDPAIARGRASGPAVGPATRTCQGPGRLRGHLILIEVFKPRQFGHTTQCAGRVIGRPARYGTIRAAITNIKIIARGGL